MSTLRSTKNRLTESFSPQAVSGTEVEVNAEMQNASSAQLRASVEQQQNAIKARQQTSASAIKAGSERHSQKGEFSNFDFVGLAG